MYIHGSFINKKGQTVAVHIVTNRDRSEEMEIGTDKAGLYFTDDPVETTSEANDTFDHLLRQSATVRLLARNYVPHFFCASCRDAVVNIHRDNSCIFAGFVEPQSYSQPFNDLYDEIELNCVDALSGLQYAKYKNVGAPGVLYNVVKAEAKQRTFYDVIMETMAGVTQGLDIVGGQAPAYLYDGSRAIDSAPDRRYTVFKNLSINELLFLGSAEDDVWQQDAVLDEMLKYLNIHIMQAGTTFYLFSWETIKKGGTIEWHDMGTDVVKTTDSGTVKVTTRIVADTDTQISIGEVYNQLLLNCNIQKAETVVENPLDEESLTPVYDAMQLYCTELSAETKKEGEADLGALFGFYNMTHDHETDYGAGSITKWYIRTLKNDKWSFPRSPKPVQGLDQADTPNYLASIPGTCSAAIMAMGSVKVNTANDDNAPVSKVDMTPYLVVSVNGGNNDTNVYPDENTILNRIPIAVYEGNAAGGNFSPADTDTTNYLVISGSVALNPLMLMTHTYSKLHNDWAEKDIAAMGNKYVPAKGGKSRYYTRKYWKTANPLQDPVWDDRGADNYFGLAPFSGDGPEEYEFEYSMVGDKRDTVSKVAVLACMLVVGDKCVVEEGSDDKPSDFVWRPYKTREQCANDDEYYQQCFTIGFNPKIGDKLIGVEHDIQNNISYTLGIDAEGTAIPIRKADKVSGRVHFEILGPVHTLWNKITRRHPSFWRHTKWTQDQVPLLAHVSSIFIKQLEIKAYSDNGHIDIDEDKDLVYMSDTVESFINKKDDIEFKISSALTVDETKRTGVRNTVSLSTPVNTVTGDGVVSVYDYARGVQAKSEQLYVDSYYNEYHAPRVVMEQRLVDNEAYISPFNHFNHPAMDKTFFVQGIGRNLMDGTALLTLKEIEE